MQGKKVKLVKGTSGKPCSNNCYFDSGKEFIVADRYLYDKSYSTQVYYAMSIGATRMEEEKVVQIACDE